MGLNNTEYSITLEELEAELTIILKALRIQFGKMNLVKDVSVQFLCNDFGLVISGIQRADYGYVAKVVRERLPGYRYVYVSNFDDLIEAKEKIIWELMCGGYMNYLRTNFSRQFNSALTFNNLANKIIDERLRRYGDRPKYKYFIESNMNARGVPVTMILANDPGFFDYMPEEEV